VGVSACWAQPGNSGEAETEDRSLGSELLISGSKGPRVAERN